MSRFERPLSVLIQIQRESVLMQVYNDDFKAALGKPC
jgi:hypothetical protein